MDFILGPLRALIFNSLFSVLSFITPSSYLAPLQTRIILLPQTHNDPIIGLRSFQAYHKGSFIQFEIAQYILAHPDYEIVDEGTGFDYDESNREEVSKIYKSNAIYVESTFPKGFPKSLRDMTVAQRMCLVQTGAVKVLFLLKKIPKVWSDMTDASRDTMLNFQDDLKKRLREMAKTGKQDDRLWDYILSEREKVVVEKVNQIRGRNAFRQRPIVIVFGSKHDFSKYFRDSRYRFERQTDIQLAASLDSADTSSQRYKEDLDLFEKAYRDPMSPEIR